MIDLNMLIEVYGDSPNNWGDRSEFQGDYINYGFWKDLNFDKSHITIEQRINSSIALYEKVISVLDIKIDDTVLEIGCGRGVGIAHVLEKIPCKRTFGIDICPSQIERARINTNKMQSSGSDIILIKANAEQTNLSENSIDKIYSIEAAQHFDSIDNFAREMKRILKPDGKLCFATYFPKDANCVDDFKRILPFISEKLETAIPIDVVCNYFYKAGFQHVEFQAIGQNVFYGYDLWVKQVSNRLVSQSHYQAYKAGLIDYYIFSIE